jgi:hypothetical protein
MRSQIEILEAAALRTQQAAGRAWADLCADGSDESQELWDRLNANYEAAVVEQDRAYAAWKAAQ